MMLRKIQSDLQHLERIPAKAGVDAVQLWDSNRDEANLWRGVAIVLFPVTLLAAIGVLIMYLTADTIIQVPQRRPPHVFQTGQVPDKYFIETALDAVNLIASFTPERAKGQFELARTYLWEPALTQFEKEVMTDELRTVTDTRRTQLFLPDPAHIRVDRESSPEKVIVRVPGARKKLIGGQPLPSDEMVYFVTLTTIPRNIFNEYGVTIVDIRLRLTSLDTLIKEDERIEQEKLKAEKRARGRRR